MMNIFATYDCPVKSALVLDDLRLNKMILESTQMLSTVVHELGVNGFYKPAYRKHPCTIWAKTSKENYLWLATHALAMCMIFEDTRNKIHGCEPLLLRLKALAHRVNSSYRTEFEDCTNLKHMYQIPVTERYRLYLCNKWDNDLNKPTWYKSKKPEFYT